MEERMTFHSLNDKERLKTLKDNTIYSVITGSTAYGLNTKDSDIDEKSVVMLPKNYLFQLGSDWETTVFHEPDTEFHSLKKMVSLLNKQNPTMLEMLFVKSEFILKQNKIGKELRNNRDLFLSQNCYHSFGGYAKQQLMRIKNGLNRATKTDQTEHLHYTLERMINNFSEKYTDINDGYFKVHNVFYDENDKQDATIDAHFDKVSLRQLNGMVSELSGAVKTANKVNNRNRKPEEKLEKHAMHLKRLMLEGIETLETGTIPVYRENDREALLATRNGEQSWDEIFDEVDALSKRLDLALKGSTLPKDVDYQKINQLYTDLMLDWY